MSRISPDELARLKQEVPLETLARARGYELEKRGKDIAIKCPFHEDKTASLVITPSENVWHCFGCGAGGSVVDWVMKHEGVGFRHAIEILQSDPTATGAKSASKLQCPFDAQKPMLDQVADFYSAQLRHDEAALTYLERRGIIETIEPFNLGVSNRTLGIRLPPRNRKLGAELRMRLIECGILRGNGREHLNGSVVVPFVDDNGAVVEMYGRKHGRTLRKGTPVHLYLPGPHNGVLNRAALEEDVVLCEAPLDAMSFYVAGITSVTCAFGTSGVTDELFNELIKAKSVHIAFDADRPGDQAAEKLCARLVERDVVVYRVRLPAGKDANDVLVDAESRKGKELLLRAAHKSDWIGGVRRQTAPLAAERQVSAPKEEAAKKEVAKPPQAKPALVVDETLDEASFRRGDRVFRVRNFKKNLSLGTMRINLLATRGERFHVDNLDLYVAKPREHFAKAMSVELGVTVEAAKKDLGALLLQLDDYQSRIIHEALQPQKPIEMTEDERKEALALLKDPMLLPRVLEDLDTLGVVGEETNKLAAFLAATSRKLKKPLAVVVQSSSAAGKSSLMDAVLRLVPDEEKVAYSAMTGQSLFYMEGGDLRHKVLAIAEEEGAERAAYALKILQSEGRLRIASTGKDPNTGRHTTSEYEVEGPAAIFTTTTSVDVDEELMNRCLVLTVDEEDFQTHEIQRRQKKKRVAPFSAEQRSVLETLHQNAQRLLRPIAVVNPYAMGLTFPSHKVRLRRDHEKYLTLISTVALLHQHQREVKQHEGIEYIEVEPSDIDVANQVARLILGRILDELPPQTRRILERINKYVALRVAKEETTREEVVFTRRQLREALSLGPTQMHTHLSRLLEMEYVRASRMKGSRTLLYRLVWRGETNKDLVLTSGDDAVARASIPNIRTKFGANSGQGSVVERLRNIRLLREERRAKFANSQTHILADVLPLRRTNTDEELAKVDEE